MINYKYLNKNIVAEILSEKKEYDDRKERKRRVKIYKERVLNNQPIWDYENEINNDQQNC